VLLVDGDEAAGSATGRRPPDRAPTTTRACPSDIAIQASKRSPAERWLCATRRPWRRRSARRERSRPTVWGVRATSGTRKMAEEPAFGDDLGG
jgi:hypothetical protein